MKNPEGARRPDYVYSRYSMAAWNKRRKRGFSSSASSSYETDPCYSPTLEKRPLKKNDLGKYLKGPSVSNWDIHDLQKLGINYEPKAVSLSKMLETIKSFAERVVHKPFPSFISSLEKFTAQALNFSFPVTPAQFDPNRPEFFETFCSQMDYVSATIKKVRNEEFKLRERDDVERDLFDAWSVRIQDFMKYYKRLLTDQICHLRMTESRYVELFMTFSRIFFLVPEFGTNECRKVEVGEELHSCIPDIRFHLSATGMTSRTSQPTVMVMHTEVKQFKKNFKERSQDDDDEEIFDIRSVLPKGIQGQLGGELLAERERTAFYPGVLGTICMGTEVIFTFMNMDYHHFMRIKEAGETTEHSCMISYTKAYNFLLQEDRNELLPVLFWLGFVQSLQ